jgi:hypothetical protein
MRCVERIQMVVIRTYIDDSIDYCRRPFDAVLCMKSWPLLTSKCGVKSIQSTIVGSEIHIGAISGG